MKIKERKELIVQTLDRLYPNPPIPLKHKDPFTLLIAVVLSAQCTDERVNIVTKELFRVGDTPQKLAKLQEEEIFEIIKTCGLAKGKAKALKKLSRQLLEKHGGEVPSTFVELEELAGVGHKTASVVMCQVFNLPAFPVDTHIHRLALRWKLSNGKNVLQTERDLKRHFPKEIWNRLHLQMIYFGREYCPARAHRKEECPLCSHF